jgi:c(7)-type cytochrome triheme protein
MKKFIVIVLVVVVSFVMVASAFASMKSVDFAGGGAGKVVFDGAKHKAKGLNCKDCHPGLFQMKKGGAPMTMKDMEAGKACGACHNGTKAFKANDPANCAKCHTK